jgi:hypothetical protein
MYINCVQVSFEKFKQEKTKRRPAKNQKQASDDWPVFDFR